MTRLSSLTVLCVACVVGCSKTADKPRSDIFEKVNRAAKAIEGSADIGLGHEKFQALLQDLSTEISVCQDKVKSDVEKKVLGAYSDALDRYKASDTLWKLKLAFPKLKDEAMKRGASSSLSGVGKKESEEEKTKRTEQTDRLLNYTRLSSKALPLTDHYGSKTEAAAIADKYGLSKITVVGWECIEADSIQVLWQMAAEKVKEANSLLN